MKQLLLLSSLLVMYSSCGSYMNKNINPYYFGMKINDNTVYKKTKQKKVRIYDYNDNNLEYFLKRGYTVKAKSSFRNTFVHLSWAQLAASKLGSDVILCQNEYVGTVSGKMVIPWYVPGETYTATSTTTGSTGVSGYSNFSAVGSKGYAFGSSSTNITGTHNSTTTTTIQTPGKYQYFSVPYSDNYYDQYALFLVKKYHWLENNNYNGDVYDSTSKNKRVIDAIEPFEWFEILDRSKKYIRILYRGKIGYISEDNNPV